ncbi:MAG: lipopolysaccharide transport periplasmic protein LptA [Oligoflexus sp.]
MGHYKGLCSKVKKCNFLKRGLIILVLSQLPSSLTFGDIINSLEDLEKLEEKKKRRKPKDAQDQTEPKAEEPPAAPSKEDANKAPASEKKPAASGEKKSSSSAKTSRQDRAKMPIRLKSDGRTTYSRNGGLIHLRDNVVVTQEDLRLQANEAKVFVDDKRDDDRIDKVELTGSVKFNKFDERPTEQVSAHGDRATFFNDRQLIELIGNARIWKGNQLIRGKRIIYDIQTGMIEVDQAVGVMQPEEKDEDE